jgi:hypothetical protein
MCLPAKMFTAITWYKVVWFVFNFQILKQKILIKKGILLKKAC